MIESNVRMNRNERDTCDCDRWFGHESTANLPIQALLYRMAKIDVIVIFGPNTIRYVCVSVACLWGHARQKEKKTPYSNTS